METMQTWILFSAFMLSPLVVATLLIYKAGSNARLAILAAAGWSWYYMIGKPLFVVDYNDGTLLEGWVCLFALCLGFTAAVKLGYKALTAINKTVDA